MAALLKNSLSQDNVDTYNFTWGVLLLMLLALVSLLLPVTPIMSQSTRTAGYDSPAMTSPPTSRWESRRVKADCWCPAYFTGAMISYVNAFCSSAGNAILNGAKINDTLYVPLYSFPLDVDRRPPTIFDTRRDYFERLESLKEKKVVERERFEKVQTDLQELVFFRAPVVLFLLALFLKVPQFVWHVLTHCVPSCINVEQTLQLCVASRSQDASVRQKLNDDTVKAVGKALRSSKCSNSCLYLFMKLLVVVVIIGEIVFVNQYVLKDIHDLENRHAVNKDDIKSSGQGQGQMVNDLSTSPRGLFQPPNNVFFCDFSIQTLKKMEQYTVQCQFSTESTSGIPATAPSARSKSASPITEEFQSRSSNSNTEGVLLLYQAIFTIALACLVVLAVATVLNTLSWFLRLFVSSYATSMGLPGDSATDAVFVVTMAWVNAGPVVARALADSPVWSTRHGDGNGEGDLEILQEMKS